MTASGGLQSDARRAVYEEDVVTYADDDTAEEWGDPQNYSATAIRKAHKASKLCWSCWSTQLVQMIRSHWMMTGTLIATNLHVGLQKCATTRHERRDTSSCWDRRVACASL